MSNNKGRTQHIIRLEAFRSIYVLYIIMPNTINISGNMLKSNMTSHNQSDAYLFYEIANHR